MSDNITSNQVPPCPGGIVYTIKSGDTFYSIAKAHGIDVNAVIKANPNVDPNNLQIGQVICLPCESNLIVYKNTQYGFTFTLPASWKGYSIITGSWVGNDVTTGQITETGPIISIRHPLWTPQNPRQDIPIMVFTINQWNSLQQGRFHIGAAPIGPSELGRNSRYVFALPARYNFVFPTGYEEVERILQSHPLHAT